jgi:hypothetical protein
LGDGEGWRKFVSFVVIPKSVFVHSLTSIHLDRLDWYCNMNARRWDIRWFDPSSGSTELTQVQTETPAVASYLWQRW